uniref:Uncharacterized protein n=1 Tax=Anguilla anguilla TaxID=7936 RepID=A0A0E9VDT1_ANGAN
MNNRTKIVDSAGTYKHNVLHSRCVFTRCEKLPYFLNFGILRFV